jgi:hypothetical protein
MYRFSLSDYENLCTVANSLVAGKSFSESTLATVNDRCRRRLAQLASRELRLTPDVPVDYDGLQTLLQDVSRRTLPPLDFLND